jgi:hypothetical protein
MTLKRIFEIVKSRMKKSMMKVCTFFHTNGDDNFQSFSRTSEKNMWLHFYSNWNDDNFNTTSIENFLREFSTWENVEWEFFQFCINLKHEQQQFESQQKFAFVMKLLHAFFTITLNLKIIASACAKCGKTKSWL